MQKPHGNVLEHEQSVPEQIPTLKEKGKEEACGDKSTLLPTGCSHRLRSQGVTTETMEAKGKESIGFVRGVRRKIRYG